MICFGLSSPNSSEPDRCPFTRRTDTRHRADCRLRVRRLVVRRRVTGRSAARRARTRRVAFAANRPQQTGR